MTILRNIVAAFGTCVIQHDCVVHKLYCVCNVYSVNHSTAGALLVTPLPTVTAPPSFSTAPASKLAAQVWNSS